MKVVWISKKSYQEIKKVFPKVTRKQAVLLLNVGEIELERTYFRSYDSTPLLSHKHTYILEIFEIKIYLPPNKKGVAFKAK